MILTWAAAHPALMTALVWPIVSAIVTALFKPRSPEEYAALPPRVAAALKLVAAIGVDAPKLVQALQQIFTRSP